MKTRTNLKASLILIAIASLSISSYASGDINISTMEEDVRARVEIKVPRAESVDVSLIDPNGYVIHSDVLSQNSDYGRVFDFSQVNDGIYTFITRTEHSTVTKTLELENQTLTVINKEISYEPIFKLEGDLLSVNYMNYSNADISISVEDSSMEYYKEEGGNPRAYGKMLSVENLPRGEYYLVLAAGDSKYYYTFYR